VTVVALRDRPGGVLAGALAEFERQFTYPLGPGRSFRISHGDDYPRFFRAVGDAAVFVALDGDRVVGTLGTAVRRILTPDGTERPAGYLGDLKVAPEVRGGFTVVRLLRAAEAWLRPRVALAFGVVMGGTRATPDRYTGRAGVPKFEAVGEIVVFRVPCEGDIGETAALRPVSEEEGIARYRDLSVGRYACPGGAPAERSESPPRWLTAADGSACGRLEDTRRAKRLHDDRGAEMVSAHLAAFASRDARAGAALIRGALRLAGAAGFPALFVAVAGPDAVALAAALAPLAPVAAPATVYACGVPAGDAWHVNSSEI
jgi:hypothetical protein